MDDKIYISKKLNLYNYLWFFFIIELAAFFLLTFYYLSPEIPIQSREDFDIGFLYVSYLVIIISVPGIYKLYSFRIKSININSDLKEKTDHYLVSLLIKYVVLEFAAVFSLIAFYLNEIKEPLYMFGIVFVIALLNKPSMKQFTNDYLLVKDESTHEEIVYMPDEVNKQNNDEKLDNSV